LSKKNPNQLTLVFKHEGKLHKFFWISFNSKDDSVYFNFYPLKNSNKKIKHKIFSGEGIIDKGMEMTGASETPFDAMKYSYHRSGLLHVKSKQGAPLEKGHYFVPFDKVGNAVQFASLLPSFPSDYPEVSEADIKNKSIIVDTAGFEQQSLAFYLFLLSKDNNNLPPSSLKSYRDVECESPKYPFRILVRVASTEKPWKNEQLIVTQSLNKSEQVD
jgi:hypothetical protein